MKKTLQDQYLLIKEGKGHKDVFIKEAKRQFPGLIRNSATYTEVANVLKSKNLINENVIGLEPINQLQSSKKESYEIAFENFLAEAKKEHFDDEKAELKKTSKQVEEDAEKNFDYEDKKNPDNLIFDQMMKGYYTEMKDPKNEDKTMEQLKAIVIKNLEKNPTYYTEKGQFGVKDLGYTMDAPGLGEPKEPKGKYKSSGYGNLKENKILKEEKYSGAIIRKGSSNKAKEDTKIVRQALKDKGIKFTNRGEFGMDFKDADLAQIRKVISGLKVGEFIISHDEDKSKKPVNEEDQIRKVVRSIINEELNEMNTTKPGDIIMFKGESMKVVDIDDVGNHKLEDKTGRVRMFNLSQIKQGTFTPEKREITTVELNEQKVKEIIKENVHKELAEINKLAEYEVYESKLAKINELIEKKSSFLERINEDEAMKALTDKKKVKELQKEVKILERAKAKIEKALAKEAKKMKSVPKKEVIDEDEPISEVASEDAEAIAKDMEDVAKATQDAADAAKELDDALEEEMESTDYRQKSLEKVAEEAEEMFERLTGRDNAGGNMSDEDALANVLSEFPAYMGEEIEFAERHLMSKFDLGAA